MLSDFLIIGGGVSGLMAALLASKKRKVTILEKPNRNFQLAKRILVSGNGRANFYNADLLDKKTYDTALFQDFKDIVLDGKTNYAKDTLDYLSNELGLASYQEGKLYYPFFNKSECLYDLLIGELKKSSVKVIEGRATKLDYNNKNVSYFDIDNKRKDIYFNDVLISVGGRSYDRDDYSYSLLDSLGLDYLPYSSALCPIMTKEKIPFYLKNCRLKGKLSLYCEERLIHEEEGEILFKEDGLSGIAVFNTTIYIHKLIEEGKKGFILKIDYSSHDGASINFKTNPNCYPPFLRQYLHDCNYNNGEPLIFTFKDFYSFRYSQVSYGGIYLNQIDKKTLSVKNQDHLYLAGEMLNESFPCGGYNMGLSLLEGYKVGKTLCQKIN